MSVSSPNWERIAVWLLGLLVVAASLGVGYLGTPFTATDEDISAVQADPAVSVSSLGDGYVLAPTEDATAPDGAASSTAMVFYPGARVHPNAYLPVLAPVVAETGVTIYVPKPPLSLAVFDSNMAGPIIESEPGLEQWYVGGHSLGGAMACRFAHRNPDRVSGLVLFGSYCDRDLSGTDLRVLTVQGSADTVIDQETADRNRANLPENQTLAVTVQGMNHTQFGAYSGQRGDGPASISYDQAHAELQRTLVEYLTAENVSNPGVAE